MQDYRTFLATKRLQAPDAGFRVEPDALNRHLFPFQRACVEWALRRGRAALWQDTGLGKSIQFLCFAQKVHEYTGGDVLILSPLAVAQQTRREAEKFGITDEVDVTVCRTQADVRPGINITNYEMLHHFRADLFSGLICDESSCIRHYTGVIARQIVDFAQRIPYRLACTATPAPNDNVETLMHAELLGIMERREALALFYKQDGNSSSAFRLRRHAEQDFWRWLGSWALAMRLPSDLGFDDDGFVLPPLHRHHHALRTDIANRETLLALEAREMSERLAARRSSVDIRSQACAHMANNSEEQWLIWCHLHAEADALRKLIPDAVEIRGSHSTPKKEQAAMDFADGKIRVLISKPSIYGWGINWQNCHNVSFVGLTDMFEEVYQGIRRVYRFGQQHPVQAHFWSVDTEGAVVRNIERKEAEAKKLMDNLVQHMRLSRGYAERDEMVYNAQETMKLPGFLSGKRTLR